MQTERIHRLPLKSSTGSTPPHTDSYMHTGLRWLLTEVAPTWLAASVMLRWIGNFNSYVVFPDNRVLVQSIASPEERLILAIGWGFGFSLAVAVLRILCISLLNRLNPNPGNS